MLTIDASRIESALPFESLIDALDRGFRGQVTVPTRHTHAVGVPGNDGTSLLMPAWTDRYYGVKVVNIWPRNRERGLPGLHSSYLLHDAATGAPLAMLDGNEITSRRTAAASALAARYLSHKDASHLLVIGCGRVGRLVPRAMSSVRPIKSIALWDIDRSTSASVGEELTAAGFNATVAENLESAVSSADIVSCATLSEKAFVRAEWLSPGSHLDLIGSFTPAMQEAEPRCFRGASVFIDTPEASQKSGDLLKAFEAGDLRPQDIRGDLYDLCNRRIVPNSMAARRTVFKAVGSALEDLVAATCVYDFVQGRSSG